MTTKQEYAELRFNAECDRVHTYHRAYVILLILIASLELFMLIRALCFFDFSRVELLAYFISYIVLFSCSVATVSLILYNRKYKTLDRLVTNWVNIYGSVIILWAAEISVLDVTRGNTMIVFLTVIMFVAAVLNMRPLVYALTTVPSTVILILQAYFCESHLVDSSGYFINLFIYVFFSVFLAYIQSKFIVKAYANKTKLEQLSYHDQLTGVFNRHTLREHLGLLPSDAVYGIGIIDLDNFKVVNDTYGHDVGDNCLVDVANLMRTHFGEQIYRFGGDEFVMITYKTDEEIHNAVKAINGSLSEKYKDMEVRISAGFYCPETKDSEEYNYFKKADNALYEAKNTGKSKVIIYKQ